jgi:hypothetical protein
MNHSSYLSRPLRPLGYVLGRMAKVLDPGIVGRLYAEMSIKERFNFWEALETNVPDEWHKAHHDLRRPLVTPSEARTGTIGSAANAGGVETARWAGSHHLEEVPKREWATPGGGERGS